MLPDPRREPRADLRPDPRIAAAATTFGVLARRCGLEPEGFTNRLIWQKHEAGRDHVVMAFVDGHRRLVLKQDFGGSDAGLRPKIEMQARASEALRNHPTAHAPEVLAQDAGAVLMAAAEGETLDELIATGSDPLPLLTQAGAWLAAFHRALGTEARLFQPKFMLNHMATQSALVAKGLLRVAEPDLFLAACAQLADRAQPHLNKPTVSAVRHGDFNLRNLIIGPDGATAIDFKPEQTAPVGYDIARLLVDYTSLYGNPHTASPAGLLDQSVRAAFFSGYDLVDPGDPSADFLIWVQLLTDWRAIPADPERQSLRQMQRLAMIIALARRGFGLGE